MAQPDPDQESDANPQATTVDDDCPNCGHPLIDTGNCITGTAEIYRSSDGTLTAGIGFNCPGCSVPLSIEQATGSTLHAHPN